MASNDAAQIEDAGLREEARFVLFMKEYIHKRCLTWTLKKNFDRCILVIESVFWGVTMCSVHGSRLVARISR
jgi:hypothetical protein